ncbi:hypothetical protein SAMN02745130_01802 [Thiothrix eikelboomii]|uniref:Uncharacterized protein n=1 Tax=Thiothrix eikelboomii TaxID=92487 RepID=A0A1T4WJE5_9GAMM|nr:hypothetical protein [Thiothrix eikelboomii]SKA77476.1 hypothetical protein SAMN02745130_01802 [Thiothrix eikelboomii]
MGDEIESMQAVGCYQSWVDHIEQELKNDYLISFEELSVWINAKLNGSGYMNPPDLMRIERELRRFSGKKELKEIAGEVKINKKLDRVLIKHFKIVPTYRSYKAEQVAPIRSSGAESVDFAPIKGNKKSMQEWIKHVITTEKGLSLDSLMPAGLQQELINRATGAYSYKDGTAVKNAWAALGLKSAHKTT